MGTSEGPGIGRRDVVVVGGGAAGLAAALQLARSRRSVVVVDGGEPRNAPSPHLHGYPGHDGRPPGELLAAARAEAAGYGAEIVAGTVAAVAADPSGDGFRVALADGAVVPARRVVLATGLVDELPDIPGVAEQWGRGVLHCPYCHGWEVRDQAIAVVATGPLAGHQALLFRQLSDRVAVVEHEPGVLGDDDRRLLAARGVAVEAGPVAEVLVAGGAVAGVRLGDGRVLDATAVVVGPRFVARTEAFRDLGLEPVPAPLGVGEVVEVDGRGATAVAGVYAAGNVVDPSHQVLHAAADGSRVGAVVNADLAHEDAARAAVALGGDTAEDWDRRYATQERWWSGHPNGALVAEVGDLPPGTALDVCCGEGADAVWLARRGWEVTAVDISEVALGRARRAAAEAGVDVAWVRADVAEDPPEAGRYDLVSIQYPALRRTPDERALHAVVDAVAPGGTLLFVHHAAHPDHQHQGFDRDGYLLPGDVAAHLGDGWVVEVDEERPRSAPPGHGGPAVPDLVLRARRA